MKVRHATINTVAHHARGGCATFNEADRDGAYLRRLPGFDAYAAGDNALIWSDHFVVVKRARYFVMLGGRRGAGKRRRDRRRRGPSRYVVAVVLHDPHTGHTWFVATHHAIAKADTSARWRRPLRALGFRLTAARLAALARRYPNGVLTGDLNTRGVVNLPGLAEHRVQTPPTMGRAHYDRLFTVGALRLRAVHSFATHSDHRALSAALTIGANQ